MESKPAERKSRNGTKGRDDESERSSVLRPHTPKFGRGKQKLQRGGDLAAAAAPTGSGAGEQSSGGGGDVVPEWEERGEM